MAYLVKSTLTSPPEQHTLDGIQSAYREKRMTSNAMVREEQQDFWYSLGELMGETSAKEFQFCCPTCREMTNAREIDVGLQVPCQNCQTMILAPDIQPVTDPEPDRPLLRRGNLLLIVGAVILCSQFIEGRFRLIVSGVGICMMINGYGKRSLFYQKHPTAI
ncbi:hypothetical protein [Brevifollis gellanilyticus]|uniref:Uncharacterized protein n=1 Tax=Brevifollis gellanilyticus TaxID=748831 RepID=A0A512M7A7_9BACT|nr:hypothetical protein [Brevifollis gellanilyticus]GEP42622.1 hypothetical protein BGE01nite_19130 [Brevifollis gellanilyticus]